MGDSRVVEDSLVASPAPLEQPEQGMPGHRSDVVELPSPVSFPQPESPSSHVGTYEAQVPGGAAP